MHTGLPLFWTLAVQRFGIDMQAVQRQHGLELMLGSPALAAVMGTDEDLAKPLMDKVDVILCEECIETRIPSEGRGVYEDFKGGGSSLACILHGAIHEARCLPFLYAERPRER